MKYLLLSLSFFFISHASFAQINPGNQMSEPAYYQGGNDTNIREAGIALQKYTKQYYLGTGLMAGGYVLVAAAAITAAAAPGGTGSENVGLATVGSITFLAGLIVQVLSHRHIGRAGQLLERGAMGSLKVQPASSGMGLGLAYSFRK